jgi:putative alpha-1,2-mannosidase
VVENLSESSRLVYRSASRLIEYAYNDFGIGLVAQGLGKTSDAAHYFSKSGDWFNIWNPNATNSGFKGFLQPRNANGTFFFDPRWDIGGVFRPDHCSPVFGHNDCFLVSGWVYARGAVRLIAVESRRRRVL